MDRKHCAGCEDNFYNGNNNLGVKVCWLLEKAQLIPRKEVDINQRPPWNQPDREFPSCYRKRGYVYVKPGQTK